MRERNEELNIVILLNCLKNAKVCKKENEEFHAEILRFISNYTVNYYQCIELIKLEE